MPSSHPNDVIKIGSSRYPVKKDWAGAYTADGITAWTRDGLHQKLSRRARQRTEAKGKASMKRGNSKPDSASGTGRKWFS